MMNLKITRARALKIAGVTEFLRTYSHLAYGYTGEMLMLRTGAKLAVQKAHVPGKTRFLIYGYHYADKDVLAFATAEELAHYWAEKEKAS